MPPIPPHKARLADPVCTPLLCPLAGASCSSCLLANTLNQDLSLRPPKVSRRPWRLPPIRAARRVESRLPAAF